MNPLVQRREQVTGEASCTALLQDNDYLAGLPPLLRRIYAHRGVQSPSDIDTSLSGMLAPSLLKGMAQAVDLLHDVMQQQGRILVVGDFDADGATSCALALRAFNAMGYDRVNFMVPNRFEYGYGLTPKIVELAQLQSPHLIITVDNGISSIEGVAAAQAAGIKVLVTDHHLPGQQLPTADAIVNPNQPGCDFPSKALAGVGVIFYVMTALRAKLRQQQWFSERNIEEPNLSELLDLVALGTVADVVPLDKNNRILVEQGLRRIRAGRACAGIQALIEVSGRSAANLVASDLGFAIGPRLNAAGRLDDISIGIAALLASDAILARDIAVELDAMNRDRQQIERGMQAQAMRSLDAMHLDQQSLPTGMCLYDESWHQGVVGIVASRVKQQFHRPVICFAPADDNSESLKGSARSIPGFHIKDALELVAARFPDLIEKFGGHAMAAGLSLNKKSFESFSAAFDDVASQCLSGDDLQAVIHSDGSLDATETNLDNARLLQMAGPWGQHFPEPVFDDHFYVLQQRIVGTNHLKLVLRSCNGNVTGSDAGNEVFDAIAFNIDGKLWPDNSVNKIYAAYKLSVNRYRGRESVQLLIEYLAKS